MTLTCPSSSEPDVLRVRYAVLVISHQRRTMEDADVPMAFDAVSTASVASSRKNSIAKPERSGMHNGILRCLRADLSAAARPLNEVFYFGGEVDEDFGRTRGHPRNGDMGAEVAIKVPG